MTRIERTVQSWPEWAMEYFYERSGMMIDGDGLAQDKADQVAFIQTKAAIRARALRERGEVDA